MSLVLFEGAAGTGKTTSLLAGAREHLAAHPLGTEQRVLALTKHHGSRRRMEAKLKRQSGVGHCVDCMTVDSFAWRLLHRWRGLARHLGLPDPPPNDFPAIASAAGCLLQRPALATWVTLRYPLLVVDELQDCKGGEIEILRHIARHGQCLCAADAFQDLSGAPDNAAISWAKSEGSVVSLAHVRRTDVEALLNAANALRNGNAPQSAPSSGFEIIAVPKAPLGGATINWRIKSWQAFGEIAVISPSKPDTSPFVKAVVDWVSTKTTTNRKNAATAGPYSTHWQPGEEGLRDDVLKALNLPADVDAEVSIAEIQTTAHVAGVHDLRDWLHKQRNVGGRRSISVAEIMLSVERIVRQRRAFGRTGKWRRVAMTVHQAKNREFESVIVLWPLRMATDAEQRKQMLYNAVTRAKRRALVIVEDPKKNRLREPPFTEHTAP